MNLAIDVGNTFIKAGIFDQGKMASYHTELTSTELTNLIQLSKPDYAIVASVGKMKDFDPDIFPLKKVVILNSDTKIPIVNLYKTPQTLGMDRIAGAVGASVLFPEWDKLVIDAGTCITYDFTDRKNQYHGGGISPGIDLRFKALNTFTEKLPLVKRHSEVPLIGGNTQESILSGVLNGVLAEVEGIINEYKIKYPQLKIIICGGDYSFFESKIKETIFAVPELVVIGLNRILEYNVSEV
jgi:type III pantothenate kinase